MPGLSGLQVLEYVQEHAPGTVCILLTAHATIDSAIHALRQGAFDYVLKPAQPKTIIEVVERGLAKRQEFLRRQNLVDLMEQTVEAFKAGAPARRSPPPRPSKPSSPVADRRQPDRRSASPRSQAGRSGIGSHAHRVRHAGVSHQECRTCRELSRSGQSRTRL